MLGFPKKTNTIQLQQHKKINRIISTNHEQPVENYLKSSMFSIKLAEIYLNLSKISGAFLVQPKNQ